MTISVRRRAVRRTVAAAIGFAACPLAVAHGQTVEQLRRLSLQDLANVTVTSVSKQPQPLSDAPAAVYVITHDEIMRSGATTLPEMLRLAPNLEVAQLNSSGYAISARGFNVGNNAALSNKLLVLIDGRSVYSPLFAGVYWDMQSVPPENIDRIEVISGPGGTLYGANAVNGVINIITRNSADTQGGVLDLGVGNLQRGGSIQYGGRLNDQLTYRLYAMGWEFSPFKNSNGTDAEDAWSRPQGGFRLDWTGTTDTATLEGDDFYASEEPSNSISGRDLVATWQRRLANGSIQAEAYYDVAKRYSNNNGGFTVDTYDVSVQHHFEAGGWNAITWGLEERAIAYEIHGTAGLFFVPAGRTLNLASIFGQDTVPVFTDRLKLTIGLKLEDEPYTGLEPLPEIRLAWKPVDQVLLWSAVSRAVRAPTPIDRDLVERAGALTVINGSFNFVPETLIAYELGTRVQVTPRASFSLSTFYNRYQDLRTLEPTPGLGLPYRWANLMGGHVYGVEVWGHYQVTDWWRLSAGFDIQHEDLFFEDGSARLAGLTLTADDPNHWASLRSDINFGHGVTWETALRYVGKLHHPGVPDYGELNTRLAWQVTPRLQLSVSGFNLIHPRHPEFIEPGVTDEVPRSFLVNARWSF